MIDISIIIPTEKYQITLVCWLLRTSVRTVDDFTHDFFIFLGTVVLTDEELKQEHFSCLPA
jgi:hypothetical protein